MIQIYEALKIISRETFSLDTGTVVLSDSVGRVLAENIFADTDLPPFNRSQMDGFAVRTKDVETASEKNPVQLEIIGEAVAGKGFDGRINGGEAVRIMTGARVARGADSVQKKEAAREFTKENGESFVEIFEATKAGQNVVFKGAEIQKGAKIFGAGEVVGAQMIAPLAAFGYGKVKVFRKPRVSILATGSEIVGVSEAPKKDQIRDSNSASLKIFAEQTGAIVEVLSRVEDNLESLKTQIAKAVGLENSKARRGQSKIENRKSEILMLSGGVSVGDYDFTKAALGELGAKIFFERVALRPGKPTVFAKLNDTLVFGLPGNPVSVAVTYFLFVRAALLKMQGAADCELKSGNAVLSQKINGAKERDSFLPAFVETDGKGKLVVKSLRFGSSSNFIEFSRANCLVFVPRNGILEAGEIVKISFLPN